MGDYYYYTTFRHFVYVSKGKKYLHHIKNKKNYIILFIYFLFTFLNYTTLIFNNIIRNQNLNRGFWTSHPGSFQGITLSLFMAL